MSQQGLIGSSVVTGQVKYLNGFLGVERAWHIGFVRRFKDYVGIVATLRRYSDGATHNLYYDNGDFVNWANTDLLNFVNGQTVEILFYNQVPEANSAFDQATSAAGERPIIYTSSAFNTATGYPDFKAWKFNGTTQYLFGNTFNWTTSQEPLYQIVAGEHISGTYAQSFAHTSVSASWQAAILGGASIGGSLRTGTATTTVTTPFTGSNPSIIGYQERSSSRTFSINGNEVLTENTSNPLNGTNTSSGIYFGRLRGRDLIMWGGKMFESLGFFSIKDTLVNYEGVEIPERLAIERVMNKTYQF
ncbi:hypothetical protein [Roseivirga thermotolerans]|uniref:Uncharacterized protein n=1 Tax=Roseivirga thermotolerans TaxID=1758176 RepID=A0ABQ3IAD9_9BACT|nr:hypothetical protein [Roseivirga thermotolerans]GHE64877.1 hypothetical protein GCM10011340_19850 [Roseivirga thermotolerans]